MPRRHNRGPDTFRAEPDTVSTHYAEVDGIEVIAREIATGPHPRWGMQHPNTYHYITRLLLANETERYECNHCHLLDPNLGSIKAHLSAHSMKIPQPLTPIPTLRTVLREAAKARRLHGPGRYAAPAAVALNKLGVVPAQGGEWTAQSVSSLYNRYKDEYPVRQPPPATAATPATAPKPRPAPDGPTSAEEHDPLAAAGNLLGQASGLLELARIRIKQAQQAAQARVYVADPELVEKAQKYDQMRGLLG